MNDVRAVDVVIWALPRLAWGIFFIVVMVWTKQAEDGWGFNMDTTFGWHSFLMSLAGPVFLTEAVLGFSSPLIDPSFFSTNKLTQHNILKVIHFALHLACLICVVLALVGICYYKSLNPASSAQNAAQSAALAASQSGLFTYDGWAFPFFTLYSPHSWVGVATMVFWGLQFIVRLIGFFVPQWNAAISRWHGFFGKAVYVLVLATCAMGLQDMQSSDLAGDGSGMGYLPFSPHAMMSSGSALVLVFLGLFVFAVPGLKKEAAPGGFPESDKIPMHGEKGHDVE